MANSERELRQEGYPDSIAAEAYQLKRKATTMFHNDHDDGDTAIYGLLADLAPLITQAMTEARINERKIVIGEWNKASTKHGNQYNKRLYDIAKDSEKRVAELQAQLKGNRK